MTPTPGSDEAIKNGCTCPVFDNRCGRGAYQLGGVWMFWVNTTCPLHGRQAGGEPTMTTDLMPKPLRTIYQGCRTIANLCDEVERLTARNLWGLNGGEKKEKAITAIERRLQALCDQVGMLPSERRALVEQITRLQAENQRLTAANVAAMQRERQ